MVLGLYEQNNKLFAANPTYSTIITVKGLKGLG